MSADELRRAAALMRERATACLPFTMQEGWWETPGLMDAFNGLTGDEDIPLQGASQDAEHIASWHPTVTLAVADWLDFVWEAGEDGYAIRDREWDQALTVARAYLGDQS